MFQGRQGFSVLCDIKTEKHITRLAKDQTYHKYYITRGWRKFCLDNRCEIGDLFAFNVVGDGKTTPLMCVCPERKECSEILSKYLSRTSGESSLGGHS
ncbi:hypothetical protein YC2023_079214 [Brassica napus]